MNLREDLKKASLENQMLEDIINIEGFRLILRSVDDDKEAFAKDVGSIDIPLSMGVLSVKAGDEGPFIILDDGDGKKVVSQERAEMLLTISYLMDGGLEQISELVQRTRKEKTFDFGKHGKIVISPGHVKAKMKKMGGIL